MNRVWYSTLAAFAVLVSASAANGQSSTFALGFDDGTTAGTTGNAGDAWTATTNATLSAELSGIAQPGAQGWSISLTADNAEISSIAFEGTQAAALFSGGFKKSELTAKGAADCAGHKGAVSAVVLSFTEDARLPAGASTIAAIGLGGTIPAGGGTATVRFVDKCQGAGQPVDNNVTEAGGTVKPTLGSKDIVLREIVSCCRKALNVGFSSALVSSPTPYDGIVDDGGGLCSGGGGKIAVQIPEGAPGSAHAFANISSDGAGGGAQGWSFSIAVDGAASLANVTTGGTTVDALFDGGFKKTEAIDPAKNGGQRGAVSAVVLSFTNPVVLPASGTESVLDITLQGVVGDSGDIRFQNGLRGSGQPVTNAVTVGGATEGACNFSTPGPPPANVRVEFEAPKDCKFSRGNANDDGKINIADPIYIINQLFRSGPEALCPDASDANDDGMVDAADAVYLINYQFTGGPAPSAPTTCGIDPTPDAIPLGASLTSCP